MKWRLGLLAAGSLLFVSVSARLWLQTPLVLTRFEFDYFLGLFADRSPESAALALAVGRSVHLLGFLALGVLFASCARRVASGRDTLAPRQVAFFAVLLAAIWTLGMPWVSPDVFFYIGTGWLDGHYGLSPYLHGMNEAPGFAGDAMFANVFPGFLHGKTAYGPLFQAAARSLTLLSGGRELLALALFKLFFLAIHLATCIVLWRLAPSDRRDLALLLYGCNPLLLFSLLTCAHNDELMLLFVLLALFLRGAHRPGWAGVALGVATSAKYASIMLLPLFVLDLLLTGDAPWPRRWRGAFGLGAAFVGTTALCHLLYPESIGRFLGVASGGIEVYRNSIYFLLPAPGREHWRTLVVAFALAAGAGVVVLIREARRSGRFRLTEACLLMWTLFFLLPNQTNQEWYLAWLLPLVALIPNAATTAFGIRLSVLFMPLVIYTVKSSWTVAYRANAVLYLVLAACALLAAPGLLFPKSTPVPAEPSA